VRIRVFAGIGIAAALLGLTGCRSSPTVAAYVGDQTVTEDWVTELIDGYVVWAQGEAAEQARAGGQSEKEIEAAKAAVTKPDRTQVVNYVVRGRLCEQARKKLKFDVEQPEIPAGASELGKVAAQAQACERALPAGAPVQPTEADAREIFNAGVAHGIFDPSAEAEAIPSLMGSQDVADALGRKRALSEALAGVNVTVNPKYGVVEVPLASFQGGIPAVSVSFGEAGPVNERPIQPSAPPQPQ